MGAANGVVQWLVEVLLDQSDEFIVALDHDLRLTFVSSSVERFTGCSSADLLGRNVVDAALFGGHAASVHEQLGRALRVHGPVRFEVEWDRGESAGQRVYDVHVVAHHLPDSARVALLLRARDITEHRRTEQDLREFRTLADNSPDNVLRYDLNCRAIYCNREVKARTGILARRLLGRTPTEAALPGVMGIEAYERQLWHTLKTGERGTVELQVELPSGDLQVHSVAISAEHGDRGEICGAVAVGRDVTEEVRTRQALMDKEREFRTLAENSPDNILRYDMDCRTIYCNRELEDRTNVSVKRLIGRTPLEGAPPDMVGTEDYERQVRHTLATGESGTVQVRVRPPNGGEYLVHSVAFAAERNARGEICGALAVGRDVTEQIAQMELIESLVRTDPLTQLANRQALHERAPVVFAAAARGGTGVGVMVLDLDQFKAVNDGMGHSAGDALLCEVARRLTGCLRANDLLVRLGGDEFVILAADVDDARCLAALEGKVHGALSMPVAVALREVRISASIGVAVYPRDGEGLEELLAYADNAMYHAKRQGRGRTEYYRAELSEAVKRRLLIEESMRTACVGEGLMLYFQPQVSLGPPCRLVGVEALLRWHHPALGLLTPDAFIQLAEETGMIVQMGRWVLETAARAAVRWNGVCADAQCADPLCVSVNVSTRQFMLDNLPEVVDEVLRRTGCDPRWLSVEITESALLEDSKRVQQALEIFRERGIQVAIDDFGTGYSALNYLSRFHVDCMKIDKSFVQAIGRSSRDGELVKAFIAMASALNLTTVAEGIETDEQAAFLLANGCRLAQGYRFGRPMPEAQFEREFLRAELAPAA